MTPDPADDKERARELAAEYAERDDPLGWFDELYRESGGDIELIPWADMKPNPYFVDWAESEGLRAESNERALVVGCGLGDDADHLRRLGFNVTAFDLSPIAIQWAKKAYGDGEIDFRVANLLEPPEEWINAFDLVLEVYTIQPLPVELRSRAIDRVASFVAAKGKLVVVTRGREDDEELGELPWPLSPKELARFESHGLDRIDFRDIRDAESGQRRFVAVYRRP